MRRVSSWKRYYERLLCMHAGVPHFSEFFVTRPDELEFYVDWQEEILQRDG